jgi:gamma-glutamylcyclotransferase (GGCT)/AIG2-like uncharacterized protein YtfP
MPAQFAFFYGTLMSGFERRQRLEIEDRITRRGRGWIEAALFDMGSYPAAVPSPGQRVWGEVVEIADVESVWPALDDIEGYDPAAPDQSLYIRRVVPVHLDDDRSVEASVYFYNAPLSEAPRIPSGDYLKYLTLR